MGRKSIGIAIFIFAGLWVISSFVLRSEWFLRSRIDPALQQLGHRFGGVFQYKRIYPMGWLGIVLEDLRFHPHISSELPDLMRIEKISIQPNIWGLIQGDLSQSQVLLTRVQVKFWLDGGATGRGHWPWLKAGVVQWKERKQGGSGPKSSKNNDIPDIVFQGGSLELQAPEGSFPDLKVQLDGLHLYGGDGRMEIDGSVQIQGLGHAVVSALAQQNKAQMWVQWSSEWHSKSLKPWMGEREDWLDVLGPGAEIGLRGIALSWPPELILYGLSLDKANLEVHDRLKIKHLYSQKVILRFDGSKIKAEIRELRVQASVQWHAQLRSEIVFEWPHLNVHFDLERKIFEIALKDQTPKRGFIEIGAELQLEGHPHLDLNIRFQGFKGNRLLSLIPYLVQISIDRATLTGQTHVHWDFKARLLQWHLDWQIKEMSFYAPWLAPELLEDFEWALKTDLSFDLDRHALSFGKGELWMGALPFEIQGEVEKEKDAYDLSFSIQAKAIDAQTLLQSLPRHFAPVLEGYALNGKFSAKLSVHLNTAHPEGLNLETEMDLKDLEITAQGPLAPIDQLKGDFALKITDEDKVIYLGPSQPQWVALKTLPSFLVQALIVAEDSRFYHHQGVDLRAIQNSLIADLKAGEMIRGGSTLVQQLAKNLFLDTRKNIARKVQEAFLAWAMTQRLSKERILEIYFNVVHWGPQIYGISAASNYYFGKKPRQLTLLESVFLVSILPNPVKYGQAYLKGVLSNDRLYKMRRVLTGLYRLGAIEAKFFRENLKALEIGKISSSSKARRKAHGSK